MAVTTVDSVTKLQDYVKAKGGDKVIRKILIANNGMAATKAIMSMRQWAFLELGSHKCLEFVVMASQDDLQANAEFIRMADAYVEVPSGKNTNNYANVNLIVETAKQHGVDAVWPGWGHASEVPALPLTLKEMGITFLGPTAPVMHALGDKIASTILAQSSGVPCIPWNGDGITAEIQSDGSIPQEPFKKACLQSYEEALACAKRIGYPVVLKASEGGGGKGIRKATTDEELKLGWEQVTTEVVGSPIFMMQMCTGARHLEVQLVGDHHGDVIALCGRDCSTQRRFQKIFEEGPPSIADAKDFREAEKAAQRLAKSVGYRGAGTVEYLYKPGNKGFYFLELNPRLQVEHPVTEGITGVNMPALQLQVGMGIPLSRVPDVRRFYGLDPLAETKIDFLEDEYKYPDCHVMAARITAENPDDAFRPTSGKIERVRFQSSPSTWGYFSIGANGGIHEFADSQFGHIFAKGPTREHARKALQLALRNISVVGEIRTPVEYLVELADTKEFRENTIDTQWLDRLIAEKSVRASVELHDMVFYAACYRAHAHVKKLRAAALEGLERGHLPLRNDLRMLQSFQVEIAQGSTKYLWEVTRLDEDSFALQLGPTALQARIRVQPDGALYVKSGERVAQVTGIEEPLGLRLRVDGHGTMVFPVIRDPSELRSDFNGKIVRYLHANGADVAEGEPFVELEAMKMIMSLRATAAGKVTHVLASGAIVAAGQLLSTLELADPSKVQMIKAFCGAFALSVQSAAKIEEPQSPHITDPVEMKLRSLGVDDMVAVLKNCLNGFAPAPAFSAAGVASTIQRLFSENSLDKELQYKVCAQLVQVFLSNERFFASLVGGDETQVKSKFTGESTELLQLIIAHDKVKEALDIMSSVLHSLAASVELDTKDSLPKDLVQGLQEVAALPQEGGYGQVKLLATSVLDMSRRKPVGERRDEMCKLLVQTPRKDLQGLADSFEAKTASYYGLDLISSFFSEADPELRSKAAEVYIRRMYRGHTISDFETLESKEVIDGTPGASQHLRWTFAYPGVDQRDTGYAVVLPDLASYASLQKSWVMPASPAISQVHILVAKAKVEQKFESAFQQAVTSTAALVAAAAPALDAKKVETVHAMIVWEGAKPTYMHYDKANAWKERTYYRNMRSSLPFLIELPLATSSYNLSQLTAGRLWAIMYGEGIGRSDAILARGVSHTSMNPDTFKASVLDDFVVGFDNIEKALLNPTVGAKLARSMFQLHYVKPIAGCSVRDLKFLQVLFDQTVRQCVVQNQSELLKLRVDRLAVKLWVGEGASLTAVRLVASASNNWEVTGFKETLGADSGLPTTFTDIESGETRTSLVQTQAEETKASKRTIARRADSTYIYDFPSLFQISLLKLWLKVTTQDQVPAKLLEFRELVLEGDKLVESDRAAGQNNVGMVAWLCTMRTPEYPAGREVIIIGNDLTIKAGSFGTVEDDVFHRASALARARGIPRLYIACNSGARLGAVEELKPLVQVAWNDPNDLMKGFEYLYLNDADATKLPEGSVRSHPVNVGGKTRHVLDAIMGLNLPSTKGGIGVENLQGSGLIAGETSRAYDETFTLSYITGRSVGIGAYLNRLGQRNIQMVHGPMILTGFQALNKLLGQQVYTTQDQLGGPHIMVPNGVTHELVQDDLSGAEAMLRWLAFVPQNVHSIPPIVATVDPIDRQVGFMPTKSPYDPRHMLAGTRVGDEYVSGFCDEGSFHEYMEGWGKTVCVARARLGGMPVGIVAVETRAVERHIPADPADNTSRDVKEAQAGQVWYPDSAHKTAQAIRDFNRGENLPLIIFANWRGFSGGTRDMFAEVLKYGAMIVDALVEYKQPVTIYIPPNGELRGGAWVVLDPKINPQQMEMFADVEARGGILEPPAAAEIVFKGDKHVLDMMHRLDDQLVALDAKAKAGENVAAAIKEREKLLLPTYRQVSVVYCDLHDRSGRMKGLGAIHEELEWKNSRTYLHWRIRRRVQENGVAQRLMAEVRNLDHDGAMADVREMCKAAGVAEDKAVAEWIEGHPAEVAACVEKARQSGIEREIYKLVGSLPAEKRSEVVRDLVGFSKVAGAA